MDYFSIENHIQRQAELRRMAETVRLRNIAAGKQGRYPGWLARFCRALIGGLLNRQPGRYNGAHQPSRKATPVRRFYSTTES